MVGRGKAGPPMVTGATVVLLNLCLQGNARPCAAAPEPVLLAQGPAEVLDMAKEALGLGQETPEGSASTGIPGGVPFLVRFRDTVGDLEAGAQVLVRGMPMGSVKEVRITFDAAHARFDIPVTIELDPRPFVAGEPTDADAAKVHAAIEALVRNGLRAELAPANLFPGGLAVALEMHADAPPAPERRGGGAGLPEIPTTGVPLEPLTEKLERLTARIAALPLEQTLAKLNDLIGATKRLVESPALATLLNSLAEGSSSLVPAARQVEPTLGEIRTLAEGARELLGETQTLIEESQPLAEDVTDTLDAISETARSMRLLAEMLERQPGAILRGKSP
jgi:paraquat-inducible protein B